MAGTNILTAIYIPLFIGIAYANNCTYEVVVYTGATKPMTVTKVCDHGCCGYYYQRECCPDYTAVIIACSVIGGIIFIAVVASIVVCCCHKGQKRATVDPSNQSSGHQMHVMPAQPPPYQEQAEFHPPPSYREVDNQLPSSSYQTKGQGFPPVD